MRVKMTTVWLVLLLVLGVFPAPANAQDAEWTVLVYLCGTDLESKGGYASYNLLEMMEAKSSDSVNVVVQTGGTARWQLDEIDATKTQRFEVSNKSLQMVDEGPATNMGDAQTLADFVKWGAENYPAEKTMLILWDHGGGSVWGIVQDELHRMDSLSTLELGEALRRAGVSLEGIGFDACLMATLEVASALSPYARYMVASEETEGGEGWAYTEFLNYLAENPQADGDTLGRVICDSFYAKSMNGPFGGTTTLSVVDLSRIPALEVAFEAMAEEMTGVTGDVEALRAFKMGARRVESYGGNTPSEGYSNMVDLGDLTIKTQSVLPDTAIDVLDALFSSVVYQVNGDLRSSANGLSVFFPISSDEMELEVFRDICVADAYYRFAVAYSGLEGGSGTANQQQPAQDAYSLESLFSQMDLELPDIDAYDVDFESFFDEDSIYCLAFTEGFETVEAVEFSLYYMDYDAEEYVELGYDNDLYSDWDEGFFADNFYGYWPTIYGYPCALYLIGEGESYNLYSIPIIYNGEHASLRAQYVWEEDDEYYEILGVWRGMDEATGMSNRDYHRLERGDEVELLFYAYSFDSGEELLYTMGGFTVDAPVVMEANELPDGAYLFQYEIMTIFGDWYYSEAILMEIDNGEIYVDWAA